MTAEAVKPRNTLAGRRVSRSGVAPQRCPLPSDGTKVHTKSATCKFLGNFIRKFYVKPDDSLHDCRPALR